MFTWRDVITGALELNGERWDDIEFTPFNEDELSMSSNPMDAETTIIPHQRLLGQRSMCTLFSLTGNIICT